jgi:hypothetical protein
MIEPIGAVAGAFSAATPEALTGRRPAVSPRTLAAWLGQDSDPATLKNAALAEAADQRAREDHAVVHKFGASASSCLG